MLIILFYIIVTFWLVGIVFGLYCVVLSIQSRLYYPPMMIVHNGQWMTIKSYYDNFVDIQ